MTLEELLRTWRQRAGEVRHCDGDKAAAWADGLTECADDLEAWLRESYALRVDTSQPLGHDWAMNVMKAYRFDLLNCKHGRYVMTIKVLAANKREARTLARKFWPAGPIWDARA